jgi:hypothetical protein
MNNEPDNQWIWKSLFECFEEGTLRSSKDEEGVYTCECKDGWYGPNCNQKRPKFSTTSPFPARYSSAEAAALANSPLSDDYKKCEEDPDILKNLKSSLAKAKKCKYIAGPTVPNGLLLGRFNITWEDGKVMPINYLGMGENHGHDLNKIKKSGGTGGTIAPSVFIEAAMAAARVDDKCVDLFLEHPRFQPDYSRRVNWNKRGTSTNMTSRLTHDVAPCLYGIRAALNFNYKSRMCKFGCKNVRIHETDIRSKSAFHILFPRERLFGETLRDLRWHHSKLEPNPRWNAEEDILKFMLYEDTMVKNRISNERIFELYLYKALAKQLAQEAYLKKVRRHVENNKPVMSFNQWLNKPMQRADYWGDFIQTNVTEKEFEERFTAVKETRSYTNWDRITQAARRIVSDFIYYRNASEKLIRKRERALGPQRSAQLRKAIIKVHNLRYPNIRDKLHLLLIGALSMDYYTLLRMLSPYDITTREGPCPTGIVGGTQPTYIMMIAGNAHTINYAYVFRELAGLPLNESDLRDLTTNPKLDNLEEPFCITKTVIMDETKISEAENSIKTGLELINKWMGRTLKGKIYNSQTGRWVKRNGKIGKQILAKKKKKSSPRKKKRSSPKKKKKSSPRKKKKSSPRIVENIRSPYQQRSL